MAIVTGRDIGNEVLAALGLPYRRVKSIALHIEPNSPAKLVIEQYADNGEIDRLVKVLKSKGDFE